MKKRNHSLLFLLLVFTLILSLAVFSSCKPSDDPNGPEEEQKDPSGEEQKGSDEKDDPKHDPSLLYLGEDGKFNYSFVLTGEIALNSATKVRSIARDLTSKGFKASEGVTESESKTDLEILVGSASVRTGCNVDPHTLGVNGWEIKVVGDRVVIAGGSGDATVKALETFVKALTEKDGVLTLARNYTASYSPVYEMTGITADGVSVSEYTVIADRSVPIPYAAASDFRTRLYEATGIWITISATDKDVEHPIYFRLVNDAGETGFRVTCKDGTLAVEASYSNMYANCYKAFADEFFKQKGNVTLNNGYLHTERANVLYYSDFGAVGDGKTDDFEAIYKTHEAANLCGQKVLADAGKTYYIGQNTKTVPILTDTDWGTATFIFDDTVVSANRGVSVFTVRSAYAAKSVSSALLEGLTLKKGQTNIGLTFEEDCMIKVVWSGHKVYVRYGLNQNEGSNQSEMFLVDKDGNIDPSTPVAWDYDKIDSITVYSLKDTPITIEGGTIITKANNQPREYRYFSRNINVTRPHTTVKNVVHLVVDEGPNGAPYSGFFSANSTYDVLFENLTFTGHKTYKLATNASNSMGTYDTAAGYSVKVTWKNCTQSNSITDTTRWGVHASNFCKDLYVLGCTMSRFDAHQGMYNVTLKNTTLGQYLNCIGGGLVYCENVTRVRGDTFISLRSDYGSTWDGDAVLINCTLEGYGDDACTTRVNSGYMFKGSYTAGWDFGYTCYMPQNVTLDNFVFNGSGVCYVFWNLTASAAKDSVNPYQICKTVTYSNMTKPTIAPGSAAGTTFASTQVYRK